MTRVARVMGVAGAALVMMSGAAFAGGTMQKAPSGTMQKAPVGGATTTTAPAIKVEAQNLTVTPAQPKAGDQVTVKFTVKNTGAGTVAKLPWSIHLYTGNQTLAQGEQTNVGPGASFDVTAQWTAKAGEQRLQGYVDPKGNVLKNTAPPAAQVKELVVMVAQPAAAAAPRLVERVLDVQKAKAVGARFADNREQAGCIVTENYFQAGAPRQSDAGFVFDIDCRGSITGEKKKPEAFASVTLKNGWKVKRVDVSPGARTNADWSWDTRPAPGSTDPRLKMNLWSDAMGQVSVGVKVWIEGPENTNPYE